MAPQTPHLQAVAGWQWEAGGEDRKREERRLERNANRRPRAQPVIYAALCICVRTDRPPPVRKHTHTCHKLSTADSERVFQRGSGVRRGALLSYVVPVRGVHSVWQVTLASRRLWGSEWVFVCPVAEGRIHRKMWEAFLCYWRVEEWMGGFHPGLSLIREGS